MLNGFFFPIPGGPAAILSPALPDPALEPGGEEPPPTLSGASWMRARPLPELAGAVGYAAYSPYGAGAPDGGGGGAAYPYASPDEPLLGGGSGYPVYPCEPWWCGGVLSW